ncbi:MAG: sugar phosphate isomerase/epimerase [Bacteroidota bacterium]|nr:sugar phosphate isomerase/epimerase [Bacteroidota bacterium]
MDISRRIFVKSGAMAVSGIALFPGTILGSTSKKVIVGIQLYSVRDDMKADPKGSLKKIAAMGYKVVEHAGYEDGKFYGYSPSDFKKILQDLSLEMYSGHVDFGMQAWDASRKDFNDSWKRTVEDAAYMGQKFVITPELDDNAQKDYDTLMKVIDLWNHAGQLCQKYQMKFGYHDDFNEDAVLNGMKIYDIIMKYSDPRLTMQQFDIANLYNAAGTNPMDILKKYPGRFESLHVKDLLKEKNKENRHDSTILGKGVLDVKDVLSLATKNGAWLLIIEQEAYQNESPMDCARDDFAAMKKWGY